MNLVSLFQELVHHSIQFQIEPEYTICYSYDASNVQCIPEAVIFPKTTKEVSIILSQCNQLHIPVTARGAGTSLAGGAVSVQNGVILNLSHMNQILEIDEDNLTATVQPGVITLENYIKP